MATFGKNILENLTTGMYSDSLVIYREYIQNACDQIDKAVAMGLLSENEGSIDIAIDGRKRSITIKDNATGISSVDFRRQLEDIANSDKERGKDKGFRGIGRLCGLAYCKTLIFKATYSGESVRSIMTMDAKKMREMISSPIKYTADDILSVITHFSEEAAEESEHGFVVCLKGINSENTDLLNKTAVEDYLSFVAPVPYNGKFTLRSRIYAYAKNLGYHIDEYRIFVGGNQIFKNYGTRLYEKASSTGPKQQYDEFTDIAFYEIKEESELVAWMWYGLCRFEKAIPKAQNPMYGFRVRQNNIQIGDNTVLAKFFKEDRGNSYFVGEVFAVSPELTPNSQRDYFNENPTRVLFEKEIKKYCFDTLHKLYNGAATVKKNYKRLQEYASVSETLAEKCKKGFVSEQERTDLEHKVAIAEQKKDAALRAIAKIPTESTPSDDPLTKVQQTIKEYYDRKGTVEKAEAAARKHVATSQAGETVPQKTKYFTDSLSKLDKSKRKLVAQIIGIVSSHVDDETMTQIKQEIEKAFK